MKRLSFWLAAVTVAAFLSVESAFAQQNSQQTQKKTAQQEKLQSQMTGPNTQLGNGQNFIDEDGNGICDRYEQGQGFRHGKGRGMGRGSNFVDENGDGVCDNFATDGNRGGFRHGKYSGQNNRRHGIGHNSK